MRKNASRMTSRRSIAEVRISDNPFMVTSNQTTYALDMEKLKKIIISKSQAKAEDVKEAKYINAESPEIKHDLSFLYRRESDKVGAEVKASDSFLAKVMSENESLSDAAKRKRTQVFDNNIDVEFSAPNESNKTRDQIESILEVYSHKPKMEQPLYTTTSNQIGFKKPSHATYNAERHPRSQKFSSSFNRNMFLDQGLNTSMTRSKIHESLDPHL